MEKIRPGLFAERTTIVVDTLLATHLGSGSLAVYATPAMIALMESAAVAAIDPLLPEGQASVGIAVEVKHLAATPPGQQVRARAEVMAVEGRKVTFRVQAWKRSSGAAKPRLKVDYWKRSSGAWTSLVDETYAASGWNSVAKDLVLPFDTDGRVRVTARIQREDVAVGSQGTNNQRPDAYAPLAR